MKRREFLKVTGLAAAAAAVPGPVQAAMRYVGSPVFTDPNSQEGFFQPLPLPAANGRVLGLYRPTQPFGIEAKPITIPAFDGRKRKLLAYRTGGSCGEMLNPILLVQQGSRLRTTLKNSLAEPTIVHWHGLILDSQNDGVPQQAVQPGNSYSYDFKIRNRGGTYWYHPHPYKFTSEQAYSGLASFFLVEDNDNALLQTALDLQYGMTDIPLVLQDKRFDSMGNVMYEPTENEWVMGYLGNAIAVNLTVKPVLKVTQRPYRFRLLNGSNARIFNLAFFAGTTQLPFQIIGSDGGLLETGYSDTSLFLAPGERAEVVLDLSAAASGDQIFLKSLPFDPMDNEGMGGAMGMADQMAALPNGAEFYVMKLVVAQKEREMWPSRRMGQRKALQVPGKLSTIPRIDTSSAPTRQILLSLAGMQWQINGESYDPARFPVTVRKNSVEIWEIMNDMMSMPHPMHLHGFQFQVLDRTGSPQQIAAKAVSAGRTATETGWKDTVLVWPGETVRVAINFSQDFKGSHDYVFHCHNLEHEDTGMMINYRIVE